MMMRQRRTSDGGQIALMAVATVAGMIALGVVSALTERAAAGPLGRVPRLVPSVWRGHSTSSRQSRANEAQRLDQSLTAAGRR